MTHFLQQQQQQQQRIKITHINSPTKKPQRTHIFLHINEEEHSGMANGKFYSRTKRELN